MDALRRFGQVPAAEELRPTRPSSTPLQRVHFDAATVEAYGARCLDGSPSGYYYRESNTGSANFAFHLEGGGLCVEPADCWDRAFVGDNDLGSSKAWKDNWTDDSNVLSDESWNPFADWNHVYIPYCSGDVHTGLQKTKNEWDLYFAGHLTVEAVVDHLLNTTNLPSSTQVLLTGDSAGGIGVFQNADWLTDKLKTAAANAHVVASPQAGFYFPSEQVRLYPEAALDIDLPFAEFASAYLFEWFGGPFLDASCQAAHKAHPHQCWSASVHYPYIETPLFVAQNTFDSNQIGSILGLDWWPIKNETKAKAFKREFGAFMVNGTKEVITSPKTDGLFLINCYKHTGNLCMRGGSLVKNFTYAQALDNWVRGDAAVPYILVDECPGPDPCNPNCSC